MKFLKRLSTRNLIFIRDYMQPLLLVAIIIGGILFLAFMHTGFTGLLIIAGFLSAMISVAYFLATIEIESKKEIRRRGSD